MYFTKFMMGGLPVQMLMLTASMLAAVYAATQTLMAAHQAGEGGADTAESGSGKHHGGGAADDAEHERGYPAPVLPISPRPRDEPPEPGKAGEALS
jgi:hypothetical protein